MILYNKKLKSLMLIFKILKKRFIPFHLFIINKIYVQIKSNANKYSKKRKFASHIVNIIIVTPIH